MHVHGLGKLDAMESISKGTNKGKGNIPLSFNCGNEGHFTSKCPHEKYEGNDDEDEFIVQNAQIVNQQNKDNLKENINAEEKIGGKKDFQGELSTVL